MKLILRRKHSKNKKSNTNKPKKSVKIRNMVKRKSSRKSSRRKSSGLSGLGKGGLFSGKVLGFKVPLVDKVIKNKSLQKVMVATGAVTTIGALIALVNNPTINKLWSNALTKDAAALMTGDIVGVIGNRVITNPQLISQVTGGRVGVSSTTQQSTSQAGFA